MVRSIERMVPIVSICREVGGCAAKWVMVCREMPRKQPAGWTLIDRKWKHKYQK